MCGPDDGPWENGAAVDVEKSGAELGPINSFGTDSQGELYVLTDDGKALKMVAK